MESKKESSRVLSPSQSKDLFSLPHEGYVSNQPTFGSHIGFSTYSNILFVGPIMDHVVFIPWSQDRIQILDRTSGLGASIGALLYFPASIGPTFDVGHTIELGHLLL